MWVPPETKYPILLQHPTRKSVGYFGAVRLRDGAFEFRREFDKFNGETFHQFLDQLYKSSTVDGKRVVIIIDNARYHHAKLHRLWRDEHQDQFQLDFLPPYSPELNPIERVWKLTRRLKLHNQYFSTLSTLTGSVEEQFQVWTQPNEELRRLCAIN